jgi:hypothetical protein
MKAQEQDIAREWKTREQLYGQALKMIRGAREATDLLMKEGAIPPVPSPLLPVST